MELYAEYLKEREGISIIVKDFGFCSYKIIDDYIYLVDIYIKKEKRRTGLAKDFIEEVSDIGKENNCNSILGGFCLDTINWKGGKTLLKHCGFKYFEKQQKTNMIFVIKEL